MKTKTIPLSNFNIDDRFLAHPPNELLSDHLNLTIKYLEKIVKAKNLKEIILDLINKIDSNNKDIIYEMFINAIYLHDIGKVNPNFQAKKMNNPLFEEYKNSTDSSDHSPLSTKMFIKYYSNIFETYSRKTKYKLLFIMYSFAYAISKHHGSLGDFENFLDDNLFKNVLKYIKDYNIPYFEFYILNKLLFSLLVSSDYYATSEYMANLKIDSFGTFTNDGKKKIQNRFYKFLESFGEPKGINKLRVEIFKEAEDNLLKNFDKNIFYLEAPTGSGKTITSINLALKLLSSNERLNKLFYIFPFNTLVEQTKGLFDNIFADSLDIEVINSITPIKEDEEGDYTKSYINRLFFHSPIVLTTHVTLFNILFGTSREDNFPLWQLANSVVILDEIQSYNNNLWWYMVEFFEKYASLLNIKIIIMSATLPKLDYFLEKKDNFVDLINPQKRDKFFNNDYFAKRVDLNFALLQEGKIDLERLKEFFYEVKDGYQKILFEFIKKQTAREFYNQIKDRYKNVYELSGDDNKAYRQFVIDKSKEDKPIIIIATQVIEAGVDIDMDLGFKDISTLDSEEQFMGRINRSCKKSNSKVYFFDLDDASKIYRGDNRLGFDLKDKKYQQILVNKNFKDYYDEVLEVIKQNGLRFAKGIKSNIDNFEESLKYLKFSEISKVMTLINSQNMTLFFPYKLDISKFKTLKEFENLDNQFLTDGMLDGQKVWDSYVQLQEIRDYAKMKVKQSYINSLMQYFSFNIIKFKQNDRPCKGEEMYGYYFVEDLSYIDENGKFNRAKFQEDCKSIFL